MPVYEYECEVCGHVLNRFFPVIPKVVPETVVDICNHHSQDPVTVVTFKKIISKTSFQLGGRGWAKDGYANPLDGVPDLKNKTGDRFLEDYRKQIADPEHPLQRGDILKSMGRKDDYRDLDYENRTGTRLATGNADAGTDELAGEE